MKRKPDQVIEYRISLQDKQSEQLDDIVTAYMIGNVLPSAVSLMKDVTGMIVVLTIIAGLIGFTFRPTGDSIDQIVDEFLTQQQQAKAAGILFGVPLGHRISQILGLWPQQS